MRRGTNHQRLKTHCPQGHEYTPENTYQLTHGWRTCRTCKNASNRRTKAKGRDVAAWRLR